MKVPFAEKVGYSLGDGAANLVFQLMMMFQLMFYTDVLGIGAGAAGLILLGARVLDAFIDPLAGILSDRTHTKWGKYRPWVVGTAIPFAVVFALSYLSPDWGVRAKTAWAAGTYALLMALYSFNNTPYSSLGGVMTDEGARPSRPCASSPRPSRRSSSRSQRCPSWSASTIRRPAGA